MTTNIDRFKEKLEAEKENLERDLAADQPSGEETDVEFNDEVADNLEDMEEREAEDTVFENRLDSVKAALESIAAGSYGNCTVCGREIEEERLEANPAASTCIEHREQETRI